MKTLNLLFVGMAMALLGGCVTYTPSISVPLEPIPEFTSQKTVGLINGQPSREKVSIKGTFHADLNEWTGLAIRIANRELTKRGMIVKTDSGAPKNLALAIVSANTEVGWVKIESEVVMQVTTSDGYCATFRGKDESYMAGNIRTEMDTCMMRVVAEMLKDPRIVAFLTK